VPDETARPIGLRDNDERGALRHEQREPLGGGPRDQHGKAGRRVAIRPVFPADGGFLYAIATAPETAYKWRFRGSSPSPEQFSGQLWADVLSQRIVVQREAGTPIGLVVCHSPNLVDAWAYLAALASPRYESTGAMVEGAALFIDEIFRNWNFRKLYMEAPEFNVDQVRSGLGKWFHEEGRLKAHHFYDGKYHDQLLLALYRDEYEQAAPFIRAALSGDLPATGIGLRSRELPDEMLDLDAFCEMLSDEFERDLSDVHPDAHLVDDLGFDSLDMVVLSVILESLSGARAVEAFERLGTVRETWLYYCELSSMPVMVERVES